MKKRLCLLFAAALLTCAGASAQRKNDLGTEKVKKVTLVSQVKSGDYRKSVFNFERGVRGDKGSPAPRNPLLSMKGLPDNTGVVRYHASEPSQDPDYKGNPYRSWGDVAPLGRADERVAPNGGLNDPRRYGYDIRFGGVTFNGTSDWLEVVDRAGGALSVIKDLGAMRWEDVTEVPLLPPSPAPHPRAVVFRRGRMIAPQRVFVKAVAGHMYLLRVKKGETDYQVMFRVESLDPNGECELTWKRFPTPKS